MSRSQALPASFSASTPVSTGTPTSGEQPSTSRPPPTVIGRYALFEQIGAGGMGVVHLGRLLGSAGFERAVAIKRVHPLLARDQRFISMFREELRLLARVRHQNVISALDVVESGDELLLVMEYVHGESLASLLQRSYDAHRPLSPEMAVTIACGVLKGLHAAHTATDAAGQPLDVIHRDVSPHNVLVGCDGVARVVDFGVAKSVGSRQMTRVGELRGKPGYVAPEQIRTEKVTRRADIYALSVVLWEMLACQRLFSKRSLPDTIEAVLSGNIPPLASVTEQDISEGLEAVVRRGLSRNADDRFETARDMAAALEKEARLVSPEEISEWVTSTAGEALTQRTLQLSWAETCPIGDAAGKFESTEDGGATLVRQFEGGALTRELPLEAIAPLVPLEPAAVSIPPAAPATKGNPVLYGTAAVVALLFGAWQLGLFGEGSAARSAAARPNAATMDQPAAPPPARAPRTELRPRPSAPTPPASNSAAATEVIDKRAQRTTPKTSSRAEQPKSPLSSPYTRKSSAAALRPAAPKPKAPSVDGF